MNDKSVKGVLSVPNENQSNYSFDFKQDDLTSLHDAIGEMQTTVNQTLTDHIKSGGDQPAKKKTKNN